MACDWSDVEGKWFGMLIHNPHWGRVDVTFTPDDELLRGKWEFTDITHGKGRYGEFNATRTADWLNVVITTDPLNHARAQLTLVEDNGASMITGVLPLPGEPIPFCTITLFRSPPELQAMSGICPVMERAKK